MAAVGAAKRAGEAFHCEGDDEIGRISCCPPASRFLLLRAWPRGWIRTVNVTEGQNRQPWRDGSLSVDPIRRFIWAQEAFPEMGPKRPVKLRAGPVKLVALI